jgi:hypothetical protein
MEDIATRSKGRNKNRFIDDTDCVFLVQIIGSYALFPGMANFWGEIVGIPDFSADI